MSRAIQLTVSIIGVMGKLAIFCINAANRNAVYYPIKSMKIHRQIDLISKSVYGIELFCAFAMLAFSMFACIFMSFGAVKMFKVLPIPLNLMMLVGSVIMLIMVNITMSVIVKLYEIDVLTFRRWRNGIGSCSNKKLRRREIRCILVFSFHYGIFEHKMGSLETAFKTEYQVKILGLTIDAILAFDSKIFTSSGISS